MCLSTDVGEIRYADANQILTDERADLETLAKGLLEFEALTDDEIKDLLLGKRPTREIGDRAVGAAHLDRAECRRRPQPSAPPPHEAATAGIIPLVSKQNRIAWSALE
jgi:hypothetical protein